MYTEIREQIEESILVKKSIMESPHIVNGIMLGIKEIIKAYQNGHKILFCGNGGSASDAEHISGELMGKYKIERKALPAIALGKNSAIVTAIGNDYKYDRIFERQVEALGKKGDVLVAISTSGNSVNIFRAISQAKKME